MKPTHARVLVTGGNGFVGTWLRRALRQVYGGQCEIFATTLNLNGTHNSEGTHWCQLDLRDKLATDQLIAEIKPSSVVHLAAVTSLPEASQNPQSAWDINFGGTMNLATAVLRHAPEARFVFVSTSAVYGGTFKVTDTPLDETACLDPENTYACSKAAADLLVGQLAHQGLQAIRFRPFNHTGPGQDERFVIPAFASQIVKIEQAQKHNLLRVGNLEVYRDFLDVRDIVQAYVAALKDVPDFTPGMIFNLASGQPVKIGDILSTLLALSPTKIQVEVDPSKIRKDDILSISGNADKARKILHWEPQIPLSQTLTEILETRRKAAVN